MNGDDLCEVFDLQMQRVEVGLMRLLAIRSVGQKYKVLVCL